MNRSYKLRFGFNLTALLSVACLLTGCIYPHTTQRSQEVRGRVLDAKTHLPIKDAKVRFFDPPYSHTTYTDADGYFRMKATKSFHWLAGPDGSGYPSAKTDGMRITHKNYSNADFWPGTMSTPDPMNILLKPNE